MTTAGIHMLPLHLTQRKLLAKKYCDVTHLLRGAMGVPRIWGVGQARIQGRGWQPAAVLTPEQQDILGLPGE